jgi:hypothetical protein
MRLPAILRSIQRLLRILEENDVAYMVIEGYALPFYGRIRTTIDIDLAVAIKTEEELNRLRSWLQQNNFEVTVGSFQNPVIVVLDKRENVEIELWLKPDGIVFDDEALRRRRKMKLDENVEAWVVSPEDFIVNKLSRRDRGAVDEQDVKSVLVRQEGKLDWQYLNRRAREAGVITILQIIQSQ